MFYSKVSPNTPGDRGVSKTNYKPEGNNSVHAWYRLIMGFDGELVKYLIERLSIERQHLVLDPFCGSGTTLVECKKNGIRSLGIDANPACVFASRVKTNWKIKPYIAAALMPNIVESAQSLLRHDHIADHKVLRYLSESGMINRGWISRGKAKKAVALLGSIDAACPSQPYRNFFRLALANAIVRRIADVKFGPEIYCLRRPKCLHVFVSFRKTVEHMINDLVRVKEQVGVGAKAKVFLGDARRFSRLLSSQKLGPVDFIITSPPYPNEHDYTRNTRLELAFLGYVSNKEELRSLKRNMIRCHTKGIYVDDCDQKLSEQFDQVMAVALELEEQAKGRSDGFSKLYGRMIKEYFGGMTAHFKAAFRSLRPKGTCAYVVCDQYSLLGVHVDTPEILKSIATSSTVGFELMDVIKWRETRGTTGNNTLTERILLFRKPA